MFEGGKFDCPRSRARPSNRRRPRFFLRAGLNLTYTWLKLSGGGRMASEDLFWHLPSTLSISAESRVFHKHVHKLHMLSAGSAGTRLRVVRGHF